MSNLSNTSTLSGVLRMFILNYPYLFNNLQVLRKIDRRISPVTQLQPLDATPAARGTAESISRTSPIIRPLHLSDPIPPIPSQPSPQSA